MEKYLGVKIVSAEPAWKGAVTDGKKGNMESGHIAVIPKSGYTGDKVPLYWGDGYKVVYEDGYESWSPKEVFEKAYKRFDESVGNVLIGMEPSMDIWYIVDKRVLKSRAIDIAKNLPTVSNTTELLEEADKIVHYLSQPIDK